MVTRNCTMPTFIRDQTALLVELGNFARIAEMKLHAKLNKLVRFIELGEEQNTLISIKMVSKMLRLLTAF